MARVEHVLSVFSLYAHVLSNQSSWVFSAFKMSKRIIERNDQLPGSSKKICTDSIVQQESGAERVLRDLSLLFPKEKFIDRVPSVVLKHMIYSCLPNRTKADKEIVFFIKKSFGSYL